MDPLCTPFLELATPQFWHLRHANIATISLLLIVLLLFIIGSGRDNPTISRIFDNPIFLYQYKGMASLLLIFFENDYLMSIFINYTQFSMLGNSVDNSNNKHLDVNTNVKFVDGFSGGSTLFFYFFWSLVSSFFCFLIASSSVSCVFKSPMQPWYVVLSSSSFLMWTHLAFSILSSGVLGKPFGYSYIY